jgi:hypothetical protein
MPVIGINKLIRRGIAFREMSETEKN